MRSSDTEFPFGPNFNFGTNNLFTTQSQKGEGSFPPVSGNMLLADNTNMNLLDNSPMLLL